MSVETDLTEYFSSMRGLGGDAAPDPDQPLWESGLLDSLSMVELIAFLEDRYGIVLDENDVVPDNFATISTVADMVSRKR